ncbi:hypothetical protein [Clostridium cylindrosporum]|uniref:Replication protein Rep n=1 Tax=Clostridium cylindrosporum DSM 605 TaxID=1121307 RepID=A0A0J8DDM9_CLOCY|nr:hypothetical protein [Clostridium cylindrosporum]KMT22333.1 replication protein Rep [Clostridium cylindrosporum DSM 605]
MGQVNIQQEFEETQEIRYISTLHRNSKGWITKVEKNKDFIHRHYKYLELLKQNFNKENTYISMNTFYSTYRRLEYLKELKAHFIDLDIYNTPFTKEQVLMNLEENYFNQSVPRPNLIVDSGRGLYLIWLINSVPSQALSLWKAVEEYLYEQLKEFGADRKALDPTRILRVPGSINSKSNTKVKVIEEFNYMYDLREIQEGYLPELTESKQKKKGRPRKKVFIYRERSLYHARIQDIIKLCELRKYKLKGHREFILFLYRYYLCYFLDDVEKALDDTLELNSMFIPPLQEREVISATRSAETVYQKKDKQYKYKNETLIDLLNISEEEQREMITIISNTEYKRRNNEYNKKKYHDKLKIEGKISEKEKISQRREKIKDLLAEGLKRKDILLQLDISLKTYKRDISFLKEQGLI